MGHLPKLIAIYQLKVFLVLLNPKVHNRVRQNSIIDFVVHYVSPVHTYKIHFNIIPYLCIGPPRVPFSFLTKM
jgi:hypothetical protein